MGKLLGAGCWERLSSCHKYPSLKTFTLLPPLPYSSEPLRDHVSSSEEKKSTAGEMNAGCKNKPRDGNQERPALYDLEQVIFRLGLHPTLLGK